MLLPQKKLFYKLLFTASKAYASIRRIGTLRHSLHPVLPLLIDFRAL